MGEIKKFVTKAKEAPKERGRVEVDVDGFHVVALEPSDYVMSQLIASASRMAKLPEQLQGAFGFLDDILEPASVAHLDTRLKNWDDPFGLEDMLDLLRYLVDEFNAIKKGRDGNRAERREAAKPGPKKAAGRRVIEGETVQTGS